MRIERKLLLRIFTDEDEKIGNIPFHKYILEKAKEEGIAGATVFRGIAGFGKSKKLREPTLLSFKSHLPIVIEIIDEEKKIKNFLGVLKGCCECLYTLEEVEVIEYT